MKNMTIGIVLAVMSGTLAFASTQKTEQRALLAYLTVQPGTEQQFLDASQDVIAESRQESGNLVYILQESVTNPEEFVFYELFKNEADLQSHRQSKHVVDFLNRVKPILIPGGFVLKEYVPQ